MAGTRLTPTRARGKRTWWVLGAVFALTMLLAASAIGVLAWPWLTLPASEEEIDRRWNRVEAWAVPDEGLGHDEELDAVQAAGEWMDDDPRRADGRALEFLAHVPARELPAYVRRGIAGLETWYAGNGGIESCSAERRPVDLLSLGRWALSTADRTDLERVRAVAHLARVLRRAGKHIDAAVGIALTEELLLWGVSRGPEDASFLEGLEPRPSERFGALAREAVCLWNLLEGIPDEGPVAAVPEDGQAPWFAPLLHSREHWMVKWYFGDLLGRGHRYIDDPDRLASFLRDEWQRYDAAPPPSVYVRALATPPMTEIWQRQREDWARLRPLIGGPRYRLQECEPGIASCEDRCAARRLRCAPVCPEGEALAWPVSQAACEDVGLALQMSCDEIPRRESWGRLRCCCGPSAPDSDS